MANYPSTVYAPRTKSNKVGVVYNPDIATTLFAQDITKLDDEVVAIETDLESKIDQAVKTDSSPSFVKVTAEELEVARDGSGFLLCVEDREINLGNPATDPVTIPFPLIRPTSTFIGPYLAIDGALGVVSTDGSDGKLELVALNTTTHDVKSIAFRIDPTDGFAFLSGVLKLLYDGTYHEMDALSYSVAGTPPVTDGTYTMGARLTPTGADGTITVQGGIITAITPAT